MVWESSGQGLCLQRHWIPATPLEHLPLGSNSIAHWGPFTHSSNKCWLRPLLQAQAWGTHQRKDSQAPALRS